MEVYPAKYVDKHGEFETTIRNDWKTLRMNVRGVEFSGSSFDYFQPEENTSKEGLDSFSLSKDNELFDFRLECDIPIKILENGEELETVLSVGFECKTNKNQGEFDDYKLLLTLKYQGQEIRSTVRGDFEDCFSEISSRLRKSLRNSALKCCFGCALSDYSVYGHDLFGSMICFKNLKERYLNMKTDYDYYDLLEEKNLEYVQETYLCSEYRVRRPFAYYRG